MPMPLQLCTQYAQDDLRLERPYWRTSCRAPCPLATFAWPCMLPLAERALTIGSSVLLRSTATALPRCRGTTRTLTLSTYARQSVQPHSSSRYLPILIADGLACMIVDSSSDALIRSAFMIADKHP